MTYAERMIPGVGVLWWHTDFGARPSGADDPPPIPADGCADVLLRDGRLRIAGPSTLAIHPGAGDSGPIVGVRFLPGTAGGALGQPAGALRDLAVSADQVLDARRASRMGAALGTVADAIATSRPELGTPPDFVAAAGASLRTWREASAESRRTGAPLEPDAGWADLLLRAAHAQQAYTEVASMLGWSERHLHRLMRDRFGYGYAALRRVARSERARDALRRGHTPAATAARVGYSDQAHLSREFARTVGMTPAAFASAH